MYLFFSVSAEAQIQSLSSPASLSNLNCYSKNFSNAFSITGNASAAAMVDKTSMGACVERKFMINDLNQYTVAATMPSKVGAFGFSMNILSYGDYHDLEPALAYAKHLGKINVGISFNYRVVSIAGYGSTRTFISSVSSLWQITEKIISGFQISMPVRIGKENPSGKFAYKYATGIGFEVSEQVFLGASMIKSEEMPAELEIGMEYQFAKKFFAGLAVSPKTDECKWSVGWKWRSLRIEALSSYHFRLGLSPGLILLYQPEDEK